jgi:hypothetical protein
LSNDGLRITLELRGTLYWFAITERGELHDSARGYSTLGEALEHAELHRRLLKLGRWREQEKTKRLAGNQ